MISTSTFYAALDEVEAAITERVAKQFPELSPTERTAKIDKQVAAFLKGYRAGIFFVRCRLRLRIVLATVVYTVAAAVGRVRVANAIFVHNMTLLFRGDSFNDR